MLLNTAFDKWWLTQSAKGDPQRNPNLVRDAFEAGRRVGRREAERDAREDAAGAPAEAMWKERQGEDYGSY